MKYIIIILFSFIFKIGLSQDSIVKQDTIIKKPISKYGYRIHLYHSYNKKDVLKKRIEFIKKYPKIETYMVADMPNYMLRVGDFISYNDAKIFYNKIRLEYETSFIFECKINLPKDEKSPIIDR